MGDSFPKPMKAAHSQDISSRINIIRKMQNIQDKEGISKAARKKSVISCKGMTNRLIALNSGGQKMSFLTSLKVITNSSIFQE